MGGAQCPESLESWLPLRCWKLWSTLVCVHLLLMGDATVATRTFPSSTHQVKHLQAFKDNTNNPRHAPPVQSFHLSDGSWVDCIPITGQISAHHPALTDHIIRFRPPVSRRSSGQARRSSSWEDHPQLFAREHGGCPEGSIPVRRTDPNRPLLKKTGSPISPQSGSTNSTNWIQPEATHEYAVTGLPLSPHDYSGAYSVFSINDPKLGVPETDFSLSQVWIRDGFYNDSTLSTVEVGWQTYPFLHPHDEPLAPHLFVYWTTDAYNLTGCYNLECPGFVQYSNTWVIGGAMHHYTTLAENAKTEYEVEMEVLYDPAHMVWWMFLNNEPVGYWPSEIFEGGRLDGSANMVQWGGEIIYFKSLLNITDVHYSIAPIHHSKTVMGSGAFPSAGYPVAAYHRNLSFADARGNFFYPTTRVLKDWTIVNDALCYDIAIQEGNFTDWGVYFFFGGSGGNNPDCVMRM